MLFFPISVIVAKCEEKECQGNVWRILQKHGEVS